ncbi:hypothetical protein BER93_17160 [Xanthomonas fragariae]|nr:hypothetical protein BER92_17105 [Xanthomonas fragariae]AOD19519.1 hypothetical protein BER93_17160 [Xanthomonas fragariae]
MATCAVAQAWRQLDDSMAIELERARLASNPSCKVLRAQLWRVSVSAAMQSRGTLIATPA